MKRSQPLEFLKQAEEDPKLGARVLAAVERGGKLTAEEILQIADEFGYRFNKNEFEKEVRRAFAARFAAVQDALDTLETAAKKKPRPRPPLSSCARGCLSFTISWHPPSEVAEK